MRRIEADLQHVPSFASGNARKQILNLVNQESELRSRKARLVETFKSENAILKNSLRYFPTLMAEASGTAAASKDTGNCRSISQSCCGTFCFTISLLTPIWAARSARKSVFFTRTRLDTGN